MADHAPPSPAWATPFETTCAAIARLLHPYAEVALHDLRADRIVGLWNPISDRAVGDPSLLEELPESWQERPVHGPYRKVLADGTELSAVSAVVHDSEGVARGLLCINMNRSPLLGVAELLQGLARPTETVPRELVVRDWREQIAAAIDEHCRDHEVACDRLDRAGRRALVAELEERGLFATRNAADHVGRALGVSRATVYTLLKEARDERTTA
jgi:predicted transcriptional regulator YheO